MKLLIPAILSGALAGAAGALAVGSLSAPEAGTTIEAVGPGEESDDVRALLDELRAQNAELVARVEALEMRPVDVARSAVEPVAAEDETLAEVRELLDALETESGDLPTSFHASVARAIEDIRAAEEAERARERAERTAERIEERVSELTVELGLSTQQASQLRDHMVAFDSKRDELRDRIREAGDWGAMREGLRELRNGQQENLRRIFTADQYARYEELDADDGFRRFGGGRGGPGGGGGRGGSRGF